MNLASARPNPKKTASGLSLWGPPIADMNPPIATLDIDQPLIPQPQCNPIPSDIYPSPSTNSSNSSQGGYQRGTYFTNTKIVGQTQPEENTLKEGNVNGSITERKYVPTKVQATKTDRKEIST